MKRNYYSAYNPSEYAWAQLFYLTKGLNVILDDYPSDGLQSNQVVLPSERLNQEDILIKKDNFLSLSEEAKEVITTVLNAPEELIEVFVTPKTKRFCKRKIIRFFRKSKKWNGRKTERVMREISLYVKNL